jgi:hypothetical protein
VEHDAGLPDLLKTSDADVADLFGVTRSTVLTSDHPGGPA